MRSPSGLHVLPIVHDQVKVNSKEGCAFIGVGFKVWVSLSTLCHLPFSTLLFHPQL